MAYARPRSMNADLNEGATDGRYKKIVADRGGVPESGTYEMRSSLNDTWYGIHETKVKMAPDGLAHITPDYVVSPGVTPR